MLVICNFFYLGYEYANDLAFSENFMCGKNPVREFCLQNYLGQSDCSSLQHRISLGWLDCLLHFLYDDLASLVEPNK